MSDKMTPITFKELLNQAIKEYKREKTIYYVPVSKERIKSPIGPAAGPHTQLAQNILAAYAGGANHFELKTVQVLEGKELGILKPCIYVEGEAYNTEWSTELTVQEALEEYIKAWFLLKLISKEFNINDENDFVFYMSVGYDLKGIKSKKIDNFIEGLKDASNTEIWKECKKYSLENLDLFENVTAEYIENITPNICNTITLSTMHGCLPEEIEKIENRLHETEKKQNVTEYLEYIEHILEALSLFDGKLIGETSGQRFLMTEGCSSYDFRKVTDLQAYIEYKIEEICRMKNEKEKMIYSDVTINAMAYINQNYGDASITAAEVAEHVGVTSSWLSTKFKTETGIRVNDFINNVRIENAKKMFQDKEYMVYEVSEKTGFTSSQYFSKIFKEYTGLTPNQYRRKLLAGE